MMNFVLSCILLACTSIVEVQCAVFFVQPFGRGTECRPFQPCATISEAAALAQDNDIIIVAIGLYPGQVNIAANGVRVIGKGRTQTFVRALIDEPNVFQITGRDVIISRLAVVVNDRLSSSDADGIIIEETAVGSQIRSVGVINRRDFGSGVGITIRGDNCLVRDSEILGAWGSGIVLDSTANSVINDNRISESRFAGISIIGLGTEANKISENTISSTVSDGINEVIGASFSFIIENTLSDCGNSAIFSGGNNPTIQDNTVTDAGLHGFELAGISAFLEGNSVDTATVHCIQVVGDSHLVFNNKVTECQSSGINIDGDFNRINNNDISFAQNGITLTSDATDNVLERNDFERVRGENIIDDGVDNFIDNPPF